MNRRKLSIKQLCKTILFFFVFSFMFNSFFLPKAFAQNTNMPTVTAKSTQGLVGENVDITISIKDNLNMAGGHLVLSYDPQVIKPESIKAGSLINGFIHIGNIAFSENSIKIAWAGMQAVTSDGDITTIRFSLKNPGTSNLKLVEVVLKDSNSKNVDSTLVNGSISVTGDTPGQNSPSVPAPVPVPNPGPGSSQGNTNPTLPPKEQVDSTPKPNPTVPTPYIPNDSNGSILPERMKLVSSVMEVTGSTSATGQLISTKLQYDNTKIDRAENLRVAYWNKGINAWVPIAKDMTVLNKSTQEIAVQLSKPTKLAVVEVNNQPTFTDVDNQWFATYIDRMAIMNITEGYTENGIKSYKPERSITRAEFVVLLDRTLSLENQSKTTYFKDMDVIPSWAKESVERAVAKGIIQGFDDNTFRPDRMITRSEMAIMIVRALGLEPEEKALSFADDNKIPQWAKGYVARAVEKGIISGKPGNIFDASGDATRAETAKMIIEMIEAFDTL